MYVGSLDGEGVLHLAGEVIDNAVKHGAGRATRLDVRVEEDGAIAIEDDGPGFAVADAAALITQLTTWSMVPVADRRPGMDLGVHGSGLMVVNAVSSRFEVTSVRDGRETRVAFARGALVGEVITVETSRASGVRVRFVPDAGLFGPARVPRAELSRRLEDVAFLLPALRVSWSFASDAAAAGGLVERVARSARGARGERTTIAHHRATVTDERGPIAIEVALAWRPDAGSPRFDTFANLARTVGGTHLDGLIDALVEFFAGSRRAVTTGLCAVVAIVLPGPQYGDYRKARLTSPVARGIAKAATLAALATWEVAHPADAAARRAAIAAG